MTSSLFLLPGFTFVLELIAFLLVLGFIAKYVVPPLRKAMNDRAEQIRNSIQAAEDAKRDADEMAARRRELLEGARAEARQIVDQANQIAEHDRLVASAQAEIEQERDRARSEVMSQLGALVLDAAERVIGAGLDEERHRALVEEAISAAQASGPERGL